MDNLNKKELRKEILRKRDNLESSVKEKMDMAIQEKFFSSEYYKNAEKIFIYISYGSEIDTKSMINRALSEGKKIYVPRTIFKDKIMDAVEIKSFDNLIEDRYGILEPSFEEEAVNPDDIDLIVVPGTAFDKNGGRMGYGAGYYDRYFKKIINKSRIVKLALTYDFQVLDYIPMEDHDVPMDIIYTEEREFIIGDDNIDGL